MQMLSAADLNPPDDVDAFIASFWDVLSSMDPEDGGFDAKGKMRAFAEERVRGVLSSTAEIDAKLQPLLDNWEIWRLGTVERSVLRLGIWEMDNTDVPRPVVINEAIDISNWFSSPRSRSIVNGVLDKYARRKG